MASDIMHHQPLLCARMNIVQKLTDLNARHLKTETRLAGIDFEAARCVKAIEAGDLSEDFSAESELLEAERSRIAAERLEINQLREALEAELRQVDRQIASQ